jgi:hypothetical protein
MTQHRECCCDPAPFTTDCLHLDKIFIHEEDEPQWVGDEEGSGYEWDGRAYDAETDFSMWGQVNTSVGSAQPENYCTERNYFRTSSWQTLQLNAGGNRKSQKNISGMGCAPCHGSLILSFKRKKFIRETFGWASCQNGGCQAEVPDCFAGSNPDRCKDESGIPISCEPTGKGCPKGCGCQCLPNSVGALDCQCVPTTGSSFTGSLGPGGGGGGGDDPCVGTACSALNPCGEGCNCRLGPGEGICEAKGSGGGGKGGGDQCQPGQLEDPWFDPGCRGEVIYDQYSMDMPAEEEMRALYIAYDDYWYLDLGASGIPYALFDETIGWSSNTGQIQSQRIRLGPQCPQSGYCTFGCPSWDSAPGSPVPVDSNWLCNPDLKNTTCAFTPYFTGTDGKTPNEDSPSSFLNDASNAGIGPNIQAHLPNIFSSVSSNGRSPLTPGDQRYPGGFSSYQMYMMQKNPTTRCLADTISFADGSNFFRGLKQFGAFEGCQLTDLDNEFTNLYSGYVGTMHRVRLWVRADMVLLQGGTTYPCTEGSDGTIGEKPGKNPGEVVSFYPPRVNERFFTDVAEGGYKSCTKEFIAPAMFLYFCSGAPVFQHELEELVEEDGNGFTESSKQVIQKSWLNQCSVEALGKCSECLDTDQDPPVSFPCNEEVYRCNDGLAEAVTALGETGKYAVQDWRKDQSDKFDTLQNGFRQAAETYRDDIISDLGEDEAQRVIDFLSTFNIPSEFRTRIESKDTELLPVQKSHRYMLPYYISQATRGGDGNPYTLDEGERYKFSGDMSNYQAIAPDITDVEEPTKFTTLERLDPWLDGQILGRNRQPPFSWRPMYGSGTREFEFNYPIQDQWDAWYQSGQLDEEVTISPWENALYELWYENIPVYFHAVPGGWAWAGDGQQHHYWNPSGRKLCNWSSNPSGGARNLGANGMNHPYKLNLNGFGQCIYGGQLITAEPFPNLIWADPGAQDESQTYVSSWLQPRDAAVVKECYDVPDYCWGCAIVRPPCGNQRCTTFPELNVCCELAGTYMPASSAGGLIRSCEAADCTSDGEVTEYCLPIYNVAWRYRNICKTGEPASLPYIGPGCTYPIQLSSVARNYTGAECGNSLHGAIGGRCVQNYYQGSKGGFRNVKFTSKNNYRGLDCPNMAGYGGAGDACCAIENGCPWLSGESGTELCDLTNIGDEAVNVIHRRENEHVVNVYPYTIRCAQTNQIDGLQRCGLLEKELHINDEEFVDNYLPSVLVGIGDPLTCTNLTINPANVNVETFDGSCFEISQSLIRSCGVNEDDDKICPENDGPPITVYTIAGTDEDNQQPLWDFSPHNDKRYINKGSYCMKIGKDNLFVANSWNNMYTPQGNYGRAVTGIPQYTCPRIGLIREVEIDRPGRLPSSATLTKCAEFYKDKRLADLDTFYQEDPMTTTITFNSLGGFNGIEYAEAFVSTGDIPDSHWLRKKVQGLSSIKLFSAGNFNVIGGFSGGVNRPDVEPGLGAGSFAGASAIIFGSTGDQKNFDDQNGWKNLKWEFFPDQPQLGDQESCTYYMKPSLNPFLCANGEGGQPEGCMDGAGLTFANKQQGNGEHKGKVYEFMKDRATPAECDLFGPVGDLGFAGPIILDSADVPFTVNIFDCYFSCITESGCSTDPPPDAC